MKIMSTIFLCLILSNQCELNASGKLYIEECDSIILLYDRANDKRNWEVHRVLFIRKDVVTKQYRIYATRIWNEEMQILYIDGKFALTWRDYGYGSRMVICPEIGTIDGSYDTDDGNGQWWGQGRIMTDLIPTDE